MPFVKPHIEQRGNKWFWQCPQCQLFQLASDVVVDDGEPVWRSELARIYENEPPTYPNRMITFKLCRHTLRITMDGMVFVPGPAKYNVLKAAKGENPWES
jgi:hypothetical protein